MFLYKKGAYSLTDVSMLTFLLFSFNRSLLALLGSLKHKQQQQQEETKKLYRWATKRVETLLENDT